jgi:hypothetical protein
VTTERVEVSLDAAGAALLDAHARRDLYGDDDEAALRDLLISWWVASHA